MFREVLKLQHALRGPKTVSGGSRKPPPRRVSIAAPAPEPDPYRQAVEIVQSMGLDEDEEYWTLRHLRNEWLRVQLAKIGFHLWK